MVSQFNKLNIAMVILVVNSNKILNTKERGTL